MTLYDRSDPFNRKMISDGDQGGDETPLQTYGDGEGESEQMLSGLDNDCEMDKRSDENQ